MPPANVLNIRKKIKNFHRITTVFIVISIFSILTAVTFAVYVIKWYFRRKISNENEKSGEKKKKNHCTSVVYQALVMCSTG